MYTIYIYARAHMCMCNIKIVKVKQYLSGSNNFLILFPLFLSEIIHIVFIYQKKKPYKNILQIKRMNHFLVIIVRNYGIHIKQPFFPPRLSYITRAQC